MNRRLLFFAAVFVVLAAAWWRWPAGQGEAAPAVPAGAGPSAPLPPAPIPAPAPVALPATNASPAEERIALADALNAPDHDIRSDLRVLNDIFQAWVTNFPRDGNPVGENAEITAALAGDNPLRLALIPRDHRAINARGEVCDRWGTPFRFHQLSGTRMEIRSAGADRKFSTADDGIWTP